MNEVLVFLFFSTFGTEDGTCLTAGILIQNGLIEYYEACLACGMGIFVGDLGLYGLGRLAGRISIPYLNSWKLKSKWYPQSSNTKTWIQLLFASRFLPGTRTILYFSAGFTGFSFPFFALTMGTAAIIWVPGLVWVAWIWGFRFQEDLVFWVYSLLGIIFILLSFRWILDNLRKPPEFWSSSFLYLFFVPLLLYLTWKHRGWRWMSASNLCIAFGGIAGESKFEIFQNCPDPRIPKTKLFSMHPDETLSEFSFPLILKPDCGERGVGVHLIRNKNEWDSIYPTLEGAYLVQEFIEGPLEAGIFFIRFPWEEEGWIFAITQKVFPELIGDGKRSIRDLILDHPRFRWQASLFFRGLSESLDIILKEGESFPLGFAGNHSRGCEFRDGKHLITEELSGVVDSIAKNWEGYYFGRWDVRFRDEESLRKGEFSILEINGATSEATIIYDPEFSIGKIYKTLFKQWDYLFQIGKWNALHKGTRLITYREFFLLLLEHREHIRKISTKT